MNNRFFNYIAFIFLFVWYACAQITPLTGGDKDIEAPQILKSIPQNNSVEISPKRIYIQFDEFIKLNNIGKQFLSSPALVHKPKFKLKGKALIIELSDTLLPNTTYTFSFGNSIVDITENNPVENFQYVFSTGKYLDSLQLSGKVFDAFALQPDDKLFVLLYPNLSDTFFKTRPAYVGQTAKDGTFTIGHIKPGKYRVLALKDINSNYRYDLPNEKVGFLPEIISLDSNIADIHIRTYNTDECLPKIKTVKELSNGVFMIEFEHLQQNDFVIKPLFPGNLSLTQYKNGDSLLFVTNGLHPKDSLLILVKGSGLSDTLRFNYSTPKDSTVKIALLKTRSVLPNPSFTFYSPLPVNIDSAKIRLFNDSLPVKFRTRQTAPNRWKITPLVQEQKIYHLYFLPKAVKNFYSKSNTDTLRFDLRPQTQDNFGTLNVMVKPAFQTPYFIILKDKSGKEISRTAVKTGENRFTFNHLLPGNYSLYCILDDNRNNRWDCGNIEQNIPPEQVIGFKNNPVKILQNWEQENEWVIKR